MQCAGSRCRAAGADYLQFVRQGPNVLGRLNGTQVSLDGGEVREQRGAIQRGDDLVLAVVEQVEGEGSVFGADGGVARLEVVFVPVQGRVQGRV